MKNIKSHFKLARASGGFNKQERRGVFFLLLIIILIQIGYFVFMFFYGNGKNGSLWVDAETQAQIDSLKARASKKDLVKIYPFNPNFISDFKGYTLGMTVDEIDRLHVFRETNEYIDSAEEFQKITKVSDSLLEVISPYFKFPKWVQKRNKRSSVTGILDGKQKNNRNAHSGPHQKVEVIRDLNQATASDLQSISGIGKTLSARIIKFRNRLEGFLTEEQLYDVYGLAPVIADRALEQFKVLKKPKITKININKATANEISKLVYISPSMAEKIIEYRRVNGVISSFDELHNIEGFPSEKIERIALYLQL